MSAPISRQSSRQIYRKVVRRQRKIDDVSRTLDLAPIEPSVRDLASAEVFQLGVASVWRHKLLLAAIAAATLALGVIATKSMPASYKAEAYIRGGFSALDAVAKDAKDEDTRNAPAISLDLSRVIETQSRLLKSQDLARRVVQQIGLDQLRPELSGNPWLPNNFFGSAAKSKQDETDGMAAKLLRGVTVTTDPRTYMIEVSYIAKDPELAAIVVNTFVVEFLRFSSLQTLSLQRSLAAATLSKQLAIFGIKHPQVIKAKMRLAAADERLKSKLSEPPGMIRQNAGENVTVATAEPSKPRMPLVVGLLLLIGLVLGVAAALWLERRRWAGALFYYYNRPFA